VLIALAAITALSLSLNAAHLSGLPGSHLDNQQQQYQKTSREHCEAKLKALGREVSTKSGEASNNREPGSDKDDVCQQIRMAEAAELACLVWLVSVSPSSLRPWLLTPLAMPRLMPPQQPILPTARCMPLNAHGCPEILELPVLSFSKTVEQG
jgi:hypothetical protein